MLWQKIWWDTRWFFLLTLGGTIPVCVLVLGLGGTPPRRIIKEWCG